MSKTRTEHSIKNVKYAIIGQILNILITLVARIIFVRILSTEYLGLSSLFTNILTVLSLAELGFTTAMGFALYEPFMTGNVCKIKSLAEYYKKIYTIIGFVIMAFGLMTVPVYPFLVKEIPDIPNLDLIYFLFVLNTSCSYFFAHKKIIVISDQKKHIETLFKYSFIFIQNALQVLILLFTHDYILFLVIQIACTLLDNICVSLYANKIYPFLKDKNYNRISKEDKDSIIANVKLMFFHKFGGVVLNSSDNIIISKYIGLTAGGLYANYYLIINAANSIITQLFSSVVASIGNLAVNNDKDRMTNVFGKMYFANFCIYILVCSGMLCCFNSFIEIWLGSEFTFDIFTVIVLVFNFYLFGMRRTVMAFREATANYKSDWFSPIIEAVLNIIFSIIFVKLWSVAGVFMGTIVSSLFTNFWLEPMVVIKKSLNINLGIYFKKYFIYLIIALIGCGGAYYLSLFIPNGNFLSLIGKMFIALIIPAITVIIVFCRNKDFLFFKKLFFKNKK